MNLASFFAGMACLAFAASSVFFLKFWRASRDPFFLYFAVACAMLAVERIVAIQVDPTLPAPENTPGGFGFYLIRIVAFLVIFVAILQKNKKNPRQRTDTEA